MIISDLNRLKYAFYAFKLYFSCLRSKRIGDALGNRFCFTGIPTKIAGDFLAVSLSVHLAGSQSPNRVQAFFHLHWVHHCSRWSMPYTLRHFLFSPRWRRGDTGILGLCGRGDSLSSLWGDWGIFIGPLYRPGRPRPWRMELTIWRWYSGSSCGGRAISKCDNVGSGLVWSISISW